MGRSVTISIWNITDGVLIYDHDNVIHGKYQKNHGPPEQILPKEIESFEVGNRTGAEIGPKGSITYSTTQNDEEFEVIVEWDHPFRHNTSSYHCYSDPLGKIKAALSPKNPKGHDQSITWTIELI